MDFPAIEAAVRGLISSGKHKTALDQAKDLHKAHGTSASEALLLDAYFARVQSLTAGGLSVEATALLNLVRERYPAAAKERLAAIAVDNLARSGRFDELLAPLNDPALPPERLAVIEGAIQEHVWDPALIALCPAIPAEHPLRQAAGAIQRAFSAVTTGPVTDEILALPEVSRRSPLAPWKMLVGALATMYRRDTQASRRYLAAIPPGSAPARLIPVIEAIHAGGGEGGKPRSPLTAAGKDLLSQMKGNTDSLKRAAQHLDEMIDEDYDDEDILRAIGDLVPECRRTAPSQLERLKQYIFIHALIREIDTDRVNSAMGGPACQDAAFHSTLARAFELDDQSAAASAAWHGFREKAVQEGWFSAEGPEVAAIYAHIANLFGHMAAWEVQEFKAIKGQHAGILLDAAALYKRASTLDPHPAVFSQWLEWAKTRRGSAAQDVAERWRQARPHDIEPLLFLISAFEKRNAFPSALRYLAEAEQIDGVNPDVRKARLRLTSANFFKQVQQKLFTSGATKTLAAIAAMPQIQQGDRPAFVQALYYILAKRNGNPAEAQNRRTEIERLLGGAAGASLLIHAVAEACKREATELPKLPNTGLETLPAVLARVAALAGDLELPMTVPYAWLREASTQFAKGSNTFDIPQLRQLGECALSNGIVEFAYDISVEGLRRGVNAEAEFLLLRAHALISRSHERAMVCALAAAGLARQRHEFDLAAKAVDFLDEMFKEDINKLRPEQLEQVLKTEKTETSFPKTGKGPSYRDLLGQWCGCPACRAARGEAASPFDEEFDEEDPFDGSGLDLPRGFPLPKGIPPEFAKLFVATMMEGLARNETPEETIARLEREMGQRPARAKRGKKRR